MNSGGRLSRTPGNAHGTYEAGRRGPVHVVARSWCKQGPAGPRSPLRDPKDPGGSWASYAEGLGTSRDVGKESPGNIRSSSCIDKYY